MSVITLHKTVAATPAELVWEAPPAKEPQASKYAPIASALKEHPGQWAVVFTTPATDKASAWRFSGTVNAAKTRAWRDGAGKFEAVCRTTGDTARVYVRYTPAVAATGLQAVTA